MLKKEAYSKIFEAFNYQNILIIGDVMVDSYIWGTVERISPEAPVPVVTVKKRENRLGGAANVALNVQALGAKPYLCSVIGNDLKGDEFIKMILDQKMSTEGICVSSQRTTTTKFRVIGNNTQLIRVDEEISSNLDTHDEKMLVNQIFNLINSENINNSKHGIDAIIFEDYDKGVITEGVIDEVVKKAGAKKIPVIVDPKKKNFSNYKNISLFKPNLKELKEGLKIDLNTSDLDNFKTAINSLRKEQKIDIVLTTLSEAGVFVSYKDKNEEISRLLKAHIRSVADVSGAGDTVISTAALCLSLKLDPTEIAHIANLAGGLVCEEVGVVPIDKEKLLKEIQKLTEDINN